MAFFNLNNKILADQKVRQAFSLATDKQQIINEVFKGNAVLPVSPWLSADQPLASGTDLEKAKGLLDAAGWKLDSKTNLRTDKKGTALELTIVTNDSLANSKAAELLSNQWKSLNVKINLSVLPGKQLSETVIKPRNFDVLIFPEKFGADPDPFPFWHSSQIKDPGFNLTGFADPLVDKLIIEARTTTDKKIREQKLAQFNDIIMSQAPVILLDQTEFIYAVDSRIKNLDLKVLYDPSMRFESIQNWYVAEKRVWK